MNAAFCGGRSATGCTASAIWSASLPNFPSVRGRRGSCGRWPIRSSRFPTFRPSWPELKAQLIRSGARELVIPESQKASARAADLVKGLPALVVSTVEDRSFDTETARTLLTRHFGTRTLDGFGVASLPLAVGAAGAALAYLRDTQHSEAEHVDRLSRLETTGVMMMDESTRTNLEVFRTLRDNRRKGSLLGLLDKCATSMGSAC